MKKTFFVFIIVLNISSTALSQEKLSINIQKSTIKWLGEYTFYFGGHDGFIKFKEGYFIKENDIITGGEFIIDMHSITNTDITDKKGNKSLVKHLKDPDFFDVKKFPLAKLVITKTKYFEDKTIRIYGNLTLKGITKSIRFSATPNYKEKSLSARFKIDRKEWNVNYQSKFKDGAISDAIGFEVQIKL